MLLPLPNEEGAGHFCLLLHVAMQFGLYLYLHIFKCRRLAYSL